MKCGSAIRNADLQCEMRVCNTKCGSAIRNADLQYEMRICNAEGKGKGKSS